MFNWGFSDKKVDPGETLLRLVTQSAARAQRYADELEALVTESPSLQEALIGESWVSQKHGDAYESGEYVRGPARLEAEERDRCANFASKAVAAGLNECMVRVAEQQGTLLAGMVTAALAEAVLPDEMAQRVKASIANGYGSWRDGYFDDLPWPAHLAQR